MIGSAMKELVAELLKPCKPTKVVLRRGFGDELLMEVAVPQLQVETQNEGDVVKVAIGTGDLEAIDLPILLPAELKKLAAAKQKVVSEKKAAESSLIRVHADKLDQLIDLVARMATTLASKASYGAK